MKCVREEEEEEEEEEDEETRRQGGVADRRVQSEGMAVQLAPMTSRVPVK